MRVLSLFDGMACGALALQAAGVEIESYDAFEIDKYAVQTSSQNFPFIKHHGDVFKADFTEFEGVDLVCGGSPCTYWSIAQKNNRETEASGLGWELFQQYVRAVKEAKPRFFIYENNKSMSKAIRASIDEAFGFEAVLINSALVSAQNRQRLYWVGRRNADGTYSKVNVEQPEDRGIVLRDILESGVVDREKSYPLLVSHQGNARPLNALYPNNCGGFEHRMFSENLNKQQVDMVAEPVGIGYRGRMENGKWVKQYESNGEPKANALTTAQTDSMVADPIRIGTIESDLKNPKHDSKQYRVYSPDGKATTLCGQGGGVGAKTGLYATPICHTIPQVVRVRKYTCDIEKFQSLLRESKKKCGLTNKDIAKKFNRPQTEVEHWFRTDKCFSVPDAEIWDKLKDFLNIETTEYDAFVTVFEEREGVFEKSDRCYDVNGKMSTLMTGKSDNIIEPTTSKKETPIYEVKDGFITIKDKQYPIKLKDGFYIIRKLTVRECMRLQTVPEWYEFPVSNSQAYKMLGNGWTVEVIAHLITSILKEM